MRILEKKLSYEEVELSRIELPVDVLHRFPKEGRPFNLIIGEDVFKVVIQSFPCTCRPDPHKHYFIDATLFKIDFGLYKNMPVIFDDLGEGRYRLRRGRMKTSDPNYQGGTLLA